MENDPFETKNIADENPELVKKAQKILKESHEIPVVDYFKNSLLGDK